MSYDVPLAVWSGASKTCHMWRRIHVIRCTFGCLVRCVEDMSYMEEDTCHTMYLWLSGQVRQLRSTADTCILLLI